MHSGENLNPDLIELYKESSNHYKHLENLRSQYVAFYFAFLPATLTYLSKESDKIGSYINIDVSSNTVLGAGILLNMIVGTLVFLAVVKLGFAIKRHEKIIMYFTEDILNKNELEFNAVTGDYGTKSPFLKSSFFNNHKSIIAGLALVILGLDVFFVFNFIQGFQYCQCPNLFLGMFFVFITVIQGFIIRDLITFKKIIFNAE